MKDVLVLLTNALDLNAEAFSVPDSNLGDLDGWDSLGKFLFISSVYDKYGVTLDPKDINAAVTAMDLWKVLEASVLIQER